MATKDTDDRPVVEQLPAGGETVNKDISRQRRKIIKASAAVVPAIMTIRSGAAVAMTSINHCEAKDAARTIPTDKLVLGDDEPFALDEWTRVQGKQVIKEGETDEVTGEVEPETYYCVKNDTTGWVCFDEDGAPPPGNSQTSLVNMIDNDNDNVTDVYLLAYVDTVSGTFTYHPQKGVYSGDVLVSGQQITGSCLCSVNPDMADLF